MTEMPHQTRHHINRRLVGDIEPGAPVRPYSPHHDYTFDDQVRKWKREGWLYTARGEHRLTEEAAEEIAKKYGPDGEFYG